MKTNPADDAWEMKNPSLKTIRERRAKIAELRRALDAEDAELAPVEKALEKIAERMESTKDGVVQQSLIPGIDAAKPALSQVPVLSPSERLIASALEVGPLWQLAVVIQSSVSKAKGRDVPMSTLSPTLTLMKKRGVIVRKGMYVALNSRLKREAETNQAAE